MESESGTGSSINMRISPSTNSNESEQFNSEKKQGISQDHIHFIPNATTTTPHSESEHFLPSNDQTNSSMMEKSDGSSNNSHLEPNLANPFGEFHPSYPNNSETSSLSSTTSQNPFLVFSDDATNITHVNANESQKLHDQVPFDPRFHQPSTYESSVGNPFQVPTTNTINDSQKIDENHDHENELHHHKLPSMEQDHWSFSNLETTTNSPLASSSSNQLDPLFTLESTQKQKLDNATDREQGHKSIASSDLGTNNVDNKLSSSVPSFYPASETSTQQHMHDSLNASSNTEDTNVHPKSGNDSHLVSESSDDDIPVSSMPKHGQHSSYVVVPETIQNPPVQIMERHDDPAATSSTNRIPLHVFARNKSNAQWSTASNESLFSIQMGNMSFSNDMAWSSKSGELDKHPPLLPPQQQATKFNDISQRTAEQHCSRVTEEKAAETMREVIMESSITPENKSKGGLIFGNGSMHSNKLSSSHNDHSCHSNGSTKSFAFKVLSDRDKTLSSKRGEDIRKQMKQSGQQNVKGTSAAAQNPQSSANGSQNKWLSCFTCCH